MALTGLVIFGIVAITIVILIREQMKKSNETEAATFAPSVYLDLETGTNKNVQLDYNAPDRIVRKHPEGGEYVLRQKGTFDNGPQELPLTKDDYKVFRFSTWTLIINNVSVLHNWLTRKIVNLNKELIQYKNLLAERDARILDLETKLEEEFNKKITSAGKMTEAVFVNKDFKKK